MGGPVVPACAPVQRTVDRKFRQARSEAGLPEKLVLYCGRHDYGTRVLQGTGNLAVVMRAMGHGSPSTAMKYQHPELEQVRRVLNGTNSHFDSDEASNGTFYGTVTKQEPRQVIDLYGGQCRTRTCDLLLVRLEVPIYTDSIHGAKPCDFMQ
jgi:hypothetical protein